MSDPTLVPYHERPQLPLLTCQEDFTLWNTMLDHTLQDFGVKRYIEASVRQPPLVPPSHPILPANHALVQANQESLKAIDAWKRHRRFILQMILISVLPVRKQLELYGFRPDEPDPYVMYRAIFSAYGAISNYRLGRYLTEFHDLEASHFATPMQFIQTFNDISRKLNGTVYELTDATKSYLLLARLAHLDGTFVEPLKLLVEKGNTKYVEVLRQVSKHFSGDLSVDGSVLAPSTRNKSKSLPQGWTAFPLVERQKAFKESFPSALQCDMCECQHTLSFLWCGSCQLCHPGGKERCYRSNSSRRKNAGQGEGGVDGSPQKTSQQPSPKPQTLPRNAATHAIGRRDSGLSEASLSSSSLSEHAQANKVNTGTALSLPSQAVSHEPAPVKASEAVKDVSSKEQDNLSKSSSTFGQPAGKSTLFSSFGAAQAPVTAAAGPRDVLVGGAAKSSSQPAAQPNKVNQWGFTSPAVSHEPAPVKSSEAVKDVSSKEQDNLSKPSSTFGQPAGKSTAFSAWGAAPVTVTASPQGGLFGGITKPSGQPTVQPSASSPFSQSSYGGPSLYGSSGSLFGKSTTSTDKAADNVSSTPKSMFFS